MGRFDAYKGVGRYQWICMILYATMCGTNLQGNVAILFVAPNEVDFYCNDPAESFSNLTWDQQKALMTIDGRCSRPDVNMSLYTSEELLSLNNSHYNGTRSCDTGFVYDHTYMDYTVTEQFDLVCGNKWVVSMSKTIFMLGYFVGALSSGAVSDKFGRKNAMIIYGIGATALNAVLAFTSSVPMFLGARCVAGAFAIGFYTVGLICQTELQKKEHRKLPRGVLSFTIDFAILIFVAVTVGIRDYRYLHGYICISQLVALILVCIFIPESPRWLVTKGRQDEAKRIARRIAKRNGWTEDQLEHLLEKHCDDEEGKKNIFHLFKTPVLRKRMIVLCCMWWCHILAFYAIIFNMGMFYRDLRVSLVISNLVEFFFNVVPMALIDRIGRQLSTMFFVGIGGLAVIGMAPLILYDDGSGKSIPLMILAVFAKLMISRQFFISYIYTQELVPTGLRSQGLGLTSTVARIGGMLGPQIILLDDLWPATSSILLGIVAILGTCLVFFLPDTTGEELPQTVEDGETFKKDHIFGIDWPRKRGNKSDSEKGAEEEMEELPTREKKDDQKNGIE